MFQEVEILRAAVCIAGVDGDISENERKLIQQLADHAGVGAASLKAMMDKALSEPNYHQTQLRYLRGNPEETMAVLIKMAIADGKMHPNERSVLEMFGKKLGIEATRCEQLINDAEASLGS